MMAKATPAPADVSTRIKQSVDQIVSKWVEKTRREVPGAKTVDDATLRNCVPQFLCTVADIASTGPTSEGGERSSIEALNAAREHGVNRATQTGYTLDQVISEYRILRELVLLFLQNSGGMERREEAKLLESFDYGIMEAAVQFTAALGFKRARASEQRESDLRDNVRDISTERDRARQELGELAKAMIELQNERELRERFVSILSHDLRTPLTAAFTRSQLIAMQSENPTQVRELATQLARDLQRTDKMIRDLLDANRIRAGERLHLNIAQTDVIQLTQMILKELAVVHGERYVLESDATTMDAFVDPEGIRRIIENLCSNAVKYGAPERPVRVSVRLRDGAELEISIHNEGRGLSAEERRSLFDQYRRASSARKEGKKGWGLGLTLVKGMAEAHGGQVSVSSSESAGTTFTVTLPQDARRFQESG